MSSYRLSNTAQHDYFEAFDHIAEHNLSAALRWQAQVLDAFDHLSEWPQTGRIRAELAPHFLRFWVVDEYVILYNPSARPVEIVAFLHGARNIADLIAQRFYDDQTGDTDHD